jgi:hypothetical protein
MDKPTTQEIVDGWYRLVGLTPPSPDDGSESEARNG